MTEEQKTNQEQARSPFEGMSWAEMMSQMCGKGEGCCAGMMEKMMGRQGQGGWGEMMPRMMSCCMGTQAATQDKAAAENTEKA